MPKASPTRRSINRNLRSSGRAIAKHSGTILSKSAEGVFRWAATDHSNFGKALQDNRIFTS